MARTISEQKDNAIDKKIVDLDQNKPIYLIVRKNNKHTETLKKTLHMSKLLQLVLEMKLPMKQPISRLLLMMLKSTMTFPKKEPPKPLWKSQVLILIVPFKNMI